MTIADTYQIGPEWGSLSAPLLQRLAQPNGTGGTLLGKLHQLALTQFQQAALPNRKNEDWKYTPLRDLLNTRFTEALPHPVDNTVLASLKQAFEATCLVFINGQYQPQLSDAMPAGAWFGTLYEALARPYAGALLEKLIHHLESITMSPFEALTTSITHPGVCLIVEKEIHLARPVHILHITHHASEAVISTNPYKLIGIGQHADVQIVESFISLNASHSGFTNSVNHILVEDGANLRHHRLQDETPESFHINMTRVFQDRDSTYKSLAVELGSKMMRNNLAVIHKGTNVTSNLYGVFIADDRQHTDTQTFIDHAQPHCTSNELYKGVLDDFARGVFNGKIIVRPDAQKTNAFQQNNTLVLSRNAIMDSKPQLEIFADDVKCSHGATIGQLDENALFYLRSRGLTRLEASSLLQRAFVGEVLDKCINEGIRDYLDKKVEAHYHA